MMRRVGERLHASWTTSRRGELEGVRNELTTSFASSFEALRRDIATEHDIVDARSLQRDTEMVHTLNRVADAFERIAESLEADRRDRRQQLDSVEFLLREMVLGFAPPTAAPPSAAPPGVLGGSIDPAALGADAFRKVDIDLSDGPIAVGTAVEVRSRFHDRWVVGFAVAEYVVGTDRRGYRLRRLAEPDQLPLLFDECDVRRATHASDLPLPAAADDPDHSMWR
jgi:hypothetical protein